MTRHNQSRHDTTAHNKSRRFLAVPFVALTTLMFVFGMVLRPMAFAEGASSIQRANDAVRAAATNAKSATVLVYMNGSDLESEAGEASSDIAEMLASGIGTNANVVIETLGTRQWQDFGIASDHTQRYAIKQGKLELVDDSLGQLDTTDPNTLADFIRWGTENYPADRYILLLWDHGAGPVYGFGYDEFQSDYAALTLDEMKQALDANPGVHFDMIGMDCCIMGSLETCVALQPYCDYMVLSEDFEPGIGWSYKEWMGKLEQNPGVDMVELGTNIVDGMISEVSKDEENGDATLALIDESAVNELFNAWVNFAYANKDALLKNNYSQQVEWRDRPNAEQVPGQGSGQNSGHAPGQGSGQGFGHAPGQNSGHVTGQAPGARPHGPQNAQNGFGGSSHGYGDNYGYGYGYGYDNGDNYGFGYDNGDNYGFGYDYGYGYDHGNGADAGWGNFWDGWDSDASYVTMTDYYVTDILEVASTMESNEATALKQAFANAVVHFGSTSGEQGMSGLAVTLPYGDAEFYDELVKVFTASGIDKDYVKWLESFVGAEGADDFYDFENVSLAA